MNNALNTEQDRPMPDQLGTDPFASCWGQPYEALQLYSTANAGKIFHGFHIYVLGTSKQVRQKLTPLFFALEKAGLFLRYTELPVSTEALPKIEQFLHQIQSGAPLKNLLIAAEKDYMQAYNRISSISSSMTPILFPNGLILPALREFTWNYGRATHKDGVFPEALQGKKILVINARHEYQNTILPLIYDQKINFDDINILNIDNISNSNASTYISMIQNNNDIKYDIIMTTENIKKTAKHLIYKYAPIFTPILSFNIFRTTNTILYMDLTHRLFFSDRTIFGKISTPGISKTGIYKSIYKNTFHNTIKDIENIKESTKTNFIIKNNIIQSEDSKNFYCTVSNGYRKTMFQPEQYDNTIYNIGKSYIFGSCVDNENTISSWLQKICNNNYAIYRKSKYLVQNYGISGTSIENMYRLISSIHLQDGDIVSLSIDIHYDYPFTNKNNEKISWIKAMQHVCESKGAILTVFLHPLPVLLHNPSPWETSILEQESQHHGHINFHTSFQERNPKGNHALLEELSHQGITAFDLMPDFQRPHNMGEVFCDGFHTGPEANKKIAQRMWKLLLTLKNKKMNAKHPVTTLSDIAEMEKRAMKDLINAVENSTKTNRSVRIWLKSIPRFSYNQGDRIGSIVMNCNPFTLGHKHIIRTAFDHVDKLYIFVVEENASFFSFTDRFSMVQEGTKEFGDNIIVAPSGKFILSSLSFPEYFNKDHIEYTPDATTDILMFGTTIAPELGISVRIFGEEPLCRVTRNYHEQMKELLPLCGLEYREILRITYQNEPISASKVRSLLKKQEMDMVEHLVPATTFHHLQ